MSTGDTPTISKATYMATSLGPETWTTNLTRNDEDFLDKLLQNAPDFSAINEQKPQQADQSMANTNRRVVQVFIADPNENVPLEHSVLFKGDQKLTDLTDTELFFEVPMVDILKSHNDKRVKFIDKEATKRSGKDVTLDPVKIRELKMVVVIVAQF